MTNEQPENEQRERPRRVRSARDISLRGSTYERLRDHAKQAHRSMLSMIEEWIAADLDRMGS